MYGLYPQRTTWVSSAKIQVMRRLATIVWLSSLLALASCSPFSAGAFTCTDDSQCDLAGGICQPTGFCSFVDASCASGQRYGENSGDLSGICVGEEDQQDCTPGELRCFDRSIGTCNNAGSGFDLVECDFTCSAGACVAASNIDDAGLAVCAAASAALEPPDGATITFAPGPEIQCAPHCGTQGVDTITPDQVTAQTGGPDAALFCLTALELGSGVTVTPISAAIAEVLIMFVDGRATIDTAVSVGGGAGSDQTAGIGGPGAGPGGDFSGGNGNPGLGDCPGLSGVRAGSTSDFGPGGGGGGGMIAAGGTGGDGLNPSGNDIGAGGVGGGTCGAATLTPLVAGSGGAGGPDGTCGAECGWPGGGGGGAIQISSRLSISIGATGSFDASGGAGEGFLVGTESGGGGGGGGSGGAILLEAPVISIDGSLSIAGGAGGPAAAGPGGVGGDGSATLVGAVGSSQDQAGEGGAGGGGGAGRVRINATDTVGLCDLAGVPAMACTAGALLAL